jgi:hypothetical protein
LSPDLHHPVLKVSTHRGQGPSVLPAGQVLARLHATDRARLAELYASIRSGHGFVAHMLPVTDCIARVGQPALVIASRNDRPVPFAHAQSLAAAVPRATLVESHADTHMIWLGPDYRAIAATIRAFLQPNHRIAPPGSRVSTAPHHVSSHVDHLTWPLPISTGVPRRARRGRPGMPGGPHAGQLPVPRATQPIRRLQRRPRHHPAGAFFHLDADDRRRAMAANGARNQLGWAVHLGTARFLNCFLDDPEDVPARWSTRSPSSSACKQPT